MKTENVCMDCSGPLSAKQNQVIESLAGWGLSTSKKCLCDKCHEVKYPKTNKIKRIKRFPLVEK
jgi:hypothetical protein